MLDVTAEDLGLWLAGNEYRNWAEFAVAVVQLAVDNDMPLDTNAWYADRAVILAGVADSDLLDTLDDTYIDALSYLDNILPHNYYFDVTDGLYLRSVQGE